MNVLFVFAHPDDEAFGPAGTIARSVDAGDNVWVLSLCKGDRPGSEQVANGRQKAFAASCYILGATPLMKDSSDVHLDYHVAMRDVEDVIKEIKPNAVYTHNITDLHKDHRLTAEVCQVACRPKPDSTIDEFYMCESPASTEWTFGQREPAFNPNVFYDVSDYMTKKEQVMALYSTETYEYPDARSIKSMQVMAMNRGRQAGVEYAEAVKLVFSRVRKSV